jgi:hypothetical protein
VENYVSRDEAENIIKEAIDDYLSEDILQEVLDLIYGSEFVIVDSGFMGDVDEEG